MERDERYLAEIARLRQKARDLGHEAVYNALSKLYDTCLLKRKPLLAIGVSGGRVVDRTSINHERF